MTKEDNITPAHAKSGFLSVSYYRIRFILSFLFLLLVILSQYFHNVPLSIFLLSVFGCLVFGGHIFYAAYEDIKNLKFTFNVLASFSILSALCFGLVNLLLHFKVFGGTTNLFVFSILNVCLINYVYSTFARSTEISKAFINKMQDFLPKSARLVKEDKEVRIFAGEIKRGDVLHVKKGEVIPTDGFILKGKTDIEETIITGNTELAVKREGDNVYAGTTNKAGDIFIEASCVLAQSEIAFVISNLKNSELKKRLSYNPLDIYAKYMAAVLMAAIVLFVGYNIYVNGLNNVEYYIRIGLFLAAMCCPSAFIVSFSLSDYFSKKGAARRGIEVQNLQALKTFKNADVLYLDKTGTLTNGVLAVAKVYPVKAKNNMLLLKSALTAEKNLQDPYSQAIKRYCKDEGITPEKVDSMEIYPGQGVMVKSGKNTILIGNETWFTEQKIEFKKIDSVQPNEITIGVARNKEFLGFITLSDELRHGAGATVENLKALGKEIILISGDGSKTVSYIAGILGGLEYHSSVLPEAKAAMIRKRAIDGKTTVMVGDGFNDILAMLEADTSVAFYSPSSAHANWVDIVIKRKDFSALNLLLKLFNIVRLNILQNIVIAFLVNIALVVFLLEFSSTPWYTVISFCLGGILLVTLNSARLVKIKL
ncbi:Cu+-exporting ATPase [Elusimicrobium simillimum]|uniref:heavy metal translocating P-type ATPase n=1 Tax=Elusimicrobium simillimum TaxID=3143438 RepID=UPI003C70177E